MVDGLDSFPVGENYIRETGLTSVPGKNNVEIVSPSEASPISARDHRLKVSLWESDLHVSSFAELCDAKKELQNFSSQGESSPLPEEQATGSEEGVSASRSMRAQKAHRQSVVLQHAEKSIGEHSLPFLRGAADVAIASSVVLKLVPGTQLASSSIRLAAATAVAVSECIGEGKHKVDSEKLVPNLQEFTEERSALLMNSKIREGAALQNVAYAAVDFSVQAALFAGAVAGSTATLGVATPVIGATSTLISAGLKAAEYRRRPEARKLLLHMHGAKTVLAESTMQFMEAKRDVAVGYKKIEGTIKGQSKEEIAAAKQKIRESFFEESEKCFENIEALKEKSAEANRKDFAKVLQKKDGRALTIEERVDEIAQSLTALDKNSKEYKENKKYMMNYYSIDIDKYSHEELKSELFCIAGLGRDSTIAYKAEKKAERNAERNYIFNQIEEQLPSQEESSRLARLQSKRPKLNAVVRSAAEELSKSAEPSGEVEIGSANLTIDLRGTQEKKHYFACKEIGGRIKETLYEHYKDKADR